MDDLLDTAPLRDQRTMVYVTTSGAAHRTTEEVEAAWQRWADEQGLPIRRRDGDYTTALRTSRKTIPVYVSGGKWIADCADCNGGVPAWPFHKRGCCLDCGTIFKLDYPPANEIRELVGLLQVRPERERNYHCHKGETLDDLRRENRVVQYPDRPTGSISLATLADLLPQGEYDELLRKIG